jgi:hypothetical protein
MLLLEGYFPVKSTKKKMVVVLLLLLNGRERDFFSYYDHHSKMTLEYPHHLQDKNRARVLSCTVYEPLAANGFLLRYFSLVVLHETSFIEVASPTNVRFGLMYKKKIPVLHRSKLHHPSLTQSSPTNKTYTPTCKRR